MDCCRPDADSELRCKDAQENTDVVSCNVSVDDRTAAQHRPPRIEIARCSRSASQSSAHRPRSATTTTTATNAASADTPTPPAPSASHIAVLRGVTLISCCGTLLFIFLIVTSLAAQDWLAFAIHLAMLLATVAQLALPYVTCLPVSASGQASAFAASCLAYAIALDWHTANLLDAWVLAFLAVSVAASTGHTTAVRATTCVTLIYFSLQALDEAMGLGLRITSPQWRSDAVDHLGQNCEGAPFRGGAIRYGWAVALQGFFLRSAAFIGHAHISSACAAAASRESAASAEVTQLCIAAVSALSRYSTADAERAIDSISHLELQQELSGLSSNLRSYQPYLPAELFTDDTDWDGDHSPKAMAPAPADRVAIVFTDIQSSTRIWETAPGFMKLALDTHNTVLRKEIRRFHGYEVKTIGDSFMVAFDSTLNAVDFCLHAQKRLFSCDWPPEILSLAECCVMEGAWCGLRVRMGVHTGVVDREPNPLTGRYDYFGTTVNKAARIQAIAHGGAVAVTTEVLQDIQGILASLGSPEVIPKGYVPLKGIGECEVFYLVPRSLAGRRQSLVGEPTSPKGFVFRPQSAASGLSAAKRNSRLALLDEKRQRFRSTRSATVSDVVADCSFLAAESENAATGLTMLLQAVVEATYRYEGVVLSVSSTGVYCSWNTMKKCVCHLHNAVKFAAQLKKAVSDTVWDERVAVGLSTGSARFGFVRPSDERYAVVVGSCMEWAASAAVETSRLPGAFCLHASLHPDCGAAADPVLKNFVRPVDDWPVEGDNQSVHVVQVNLRALSSSTTWCTADPPDEWAWSDGYRRAFEQRDWPRLSQCSDPIVKCVMMNLREETYLRRPITPGFTVVSCSSSPSSHAHPARTFLSHGGVTSVSTLSSFAQSGLSQLSHPNPFGIQHQRSTDFLDP